MNTLKNLIISIITILCLSQTAQSRTFGLFIGYSKYGQDDIEVFNSIYEDAEDIYNFYKSAVDKGFFLFLSNEKATTKNIIKVAKRHFSHAKKDDTIVFFISTHGYNGGACTYDGYISTQQIREIFHNTKAGNKFIIAQCCHSGSFNTTPDIITSTQDTWNNLGNIAQNGRSNVVILTSSRNYQYSYGSYYGNSYFLDQLLNALNGEADYNNDGIISIEETYNYLKESFKNNTEQTPQMIGRFNKNAPFIEQ